MTEIMKWKDSVGEDSLYPGDVHVWAWRHAEASESPDADISCLSSEELRRFRRFRFVSDRLRFATSHSNTRRILARYVNQSPADLVFSAAHAGKPVLCGDVPHLLFNLSHSKTFGLLAVATDLEVGVDIEEPREMQHALAERYFSPVELQMLSELEEEQWLAGFLRCWTRKEAILKAEGLGLYPLPLDAFDVSLKAGEVPALLGVRPPAVFRFPWLLYDVSPDDGAFACLAVSGPATTIGLFRYGGGECSPQF